MRSDRRRAPAPDRLFGRKTLPPYRGGTEEKRLYYRELNLRRYRKMPRFFIYSPAYKKTNYVKIACFPFFYIVLSCPKQKSVVFKTLSPLKPHFFSIFSSTAFAAHLISNLPLQKL